MSDFYQFSLTAMIDQSQRQKSILDMAFGKLIIYFFLEKEECGVTPPKLQQILQAIRTKVRRMQLMHPQLSAGFHSKPILQHDRFHIFIDSGQLKLEQYHVIEMMKAYGDVEYKS